MILMVYFTPKIYIIYNPLKSYNDSTVLLILKSSDFIFLNTTITVSDTRLYQLLLYETSERYSAHDITKEALTSVAWMSRLLYSIALLLTMVIIRK